MSYSAIPTFRNPLLKILDPPLLLHAIQLLHVVQFLPQCAACCTVAAIVNASVLGCHMSYSCSCCVVTATVYATVLCVAVCCTVAHVVQLLSLCMPVFCVAAYHCQCCTVAATVYTAVLRTRMCFRILYFLCIFSATCCRAVCLQLHSCNDSILQ